jgi:hypothetical protein
VQRDSVFLPFYNYVASGISTLRVARSKYIFMAVAPRRERKWGWTSFGSEEACLADCAAQSREKFGRTSGNPEAGRDIIEIAETTAVKRSGQVLVKSILLNRDIAAPPQKVIFRTPFVKLKTQTHTIRLFFHRNLLLVHRNCTLLPRSGNLPFLFIVCKCKVEGARVTIFK